MTYKIVISQLVPPKSLGDSLQSYVAIMLIKKLLPKVDITFTCPRLQEQSFVFEKLRLGCNYLDFTEKSLVKIFMKLFYSNKRRIVINKTVSPPSITQNLCYKVIWENPLITLASFIVKVIFKFDAALCAGHTISGSLENFIMQYEVLRSITKGPLISFPISISELTLERYKESGLLRKLKNSLQKFDFIYVRGPYSLSILENDLGIYGKKDMALDSGFGMKLINYDTGMKSDYSKRKELTIIITPRKGYFYWYNKEHLYKLYINMLTDIILWLIKHFNAKIYLTSTSAYHDSLSDYATIRDIVKLLKMCIDSQYLNTYLKIIYLNNILDAYKLYTSADLVITGRMHAGIMAMCRGIPTFFMIPSAETKVLDILSFLNLDINLFLVDIFNTSPLERRSITERIEEVIQKKTQYAQIINTAINTHLHNLYAPINKLIDCLNMG